VKPRALFATKITLLIIGISALVCMPYLIWGDAYVLPFLESHTDRLTALVIIAIILLAVDSVAPVPATLVIIFLAAKAGWLAGIVGGTIGMTAGVVTAAWFGRFALGRIAPRFFPERELTRLRAGITHNLALTLACWRCVPVLAEASVMLAGAAGIPLARIVRVTLLPNFLISLVYSFAADDSFKSAALAFTLILFCSLALWAITSRWARTSSRTPNA
jgi:uncharacterized membrane protein YdjX (TVP38/TMEM64 family)